MREVPWRGGLVAAAAALLCTGSAALARHSTPPPLQVGAASVNITPRYFPRGAPFPSPVPPSCSTKTPPGTTPQAYFNGVRYFAFEDPYHVDPGSPPDEFDPSAQGGAGEPFCKLDGRPFRVPEYGHVIDPAARYEGIYLAGGDGQNRTAKAILPDDPLGAQAIVFQRGPRRVALVALDSIGTFKADLQRIRDLVAKQRPQLAGMKIVISSTHDESAPDPLGIWGPTQTTTGVNHLYVNWEVARVAGAIERAAAHTQPARLKLGDALDPSNFLPCFSSYPYLADRHIHVLEAVATGSPDRTIATMMNYGIHDETLGFSGEPPHDLRLKGPDAADPRGYYRRVMAGDWGGFFRRDVEARLGGVAMIMPGPVGSVEMPVVFPSGTRVSRTPVVGPGAHAPATNGDKALGDCGRTVERPPARAPLTIDQLARARDIGGFLAQDAIGTLARAPFSRGTALSVTSSRPITLSLRDNFLFDFAAAAGLFPDRPVFRAPDGTYELKTQVSLVRIADAEMITMPGETFPQVTIRGYFGPEDMAFPQEPITPWLATEMSAPHRFFLGLSQDMVGYLMPPGNFVGDCVSDDGHGHCTQTQARDDPWHAWELLAAHASNDRFGQHHSDDSESLGPVEGVIAAATRRLLLTYPPRDAIVLHGRYIDPNGKLDRSPLHGAVGVWTLPPGEIAFAPGRGMIYAFPGRRLPRGVRSSRTALAVIDYDGLVQPGVADGTAGVLIGSRGGPLRLYVDVYRNLG
ncbi:MAG: hypothetical protein ACR2MK_10385 [Solirubrobacteraceae bacterium]